jgi:hypothetical protein
MKETKYILFTCFLLFGSSVYAQTDTLSQSEELPTDQVEVIKNFRANTLNTAAIFHSPVIDEIVREKQIFIYDFEIPKIEFEPPVPKIRPLAYDEPLIKELHDGFVDLSFGSLSFPRVAAGYNYNIEDWFEIGFTGSYYTIDDSEIDFRDVNHTDLNVYSTYHLSPSLAVKAGLNYHLDDRYFFAKPLSLLPDVQDSLNRSFNRFVFNGGLQYVQNKKNGVIAELMFNYWQTDIDNYGVNEDVFDFDFSLDKVINERVVFSLLANYKTYNSDQENFDVSSNLNYFKVAPQVRYRKGKSDLFVSAEVNKLGDSSLVLNPTAILKQSISEVVNVHIGYSSLYQVQDANHVYQKNSHAAFAFYSYDGYQLNQAFLQPEYIIGEKTLSLKIAYNFEENAFINGIFLDPNLVNLSRLPSDKYISIGSKIAIEDWPIRLIVDGNYRFRKDSEFLLPKWDASLQLSKSFIEDKLDVSLNFKLIDKYNLLMNSNPGLAKQNEILNSLNLSTRYKVMDKLSLYVEADNLMNQQYEFANNYMTYGLIVRGGVFVKF